MNYGDHRDLKGVVHNPGKAAPKSLRATKPLLDFCRAEFPKLYAMKPVGGLNARDQVDAAIDQWAESLVAIIEASDNPEASLLQAHRAIARKHHELETIAWREIETRDQASEDLHG